jgi:hypothetical protein
MSLRSTTGDWRDRSVWHGVVVFGRVGFQFGTELPNHFRVLRGEIVFLTDVLG